MVGESNQNVLLIQIDASSFTEFKTSEFEIARVDCSFQNTNFLNSQPNPMMLPVIGIVSENHRVWLRNEKVIMKTVLFTVSSL